MSINFETLKMGFKAYLESLEKESGSEENSEETAVSDVSIFMHSEEFKEYVSDELNIDLSDLPMDISELANMEIINGELVNKEQSDNQENSDGESNIVTDFFNELIKDDEAISKLDKDGDKSINIEELTNFFNFISENDKNSKNVSLEDIFTGLEQLKEGKYDPNKIVETEETEKDKEPKQTSSSGGVSGGGGSYNGSTTPKSEPKEKDYKDMSLEELSTTKADYEAKREEAKGLVNQIFSGENGVVKAAKDALNEKKTAYDEAVKNDENISKELKTERENNLKDIESKESSVDSLNININDKEHEISNLDNQIASKNSELSALQTSLSSLQSSSTDDKEIQAQIESQKQTVQTQITQVQEAIKQMEQQNTQLEEEKKGFEDKLKVEEEALATLETQRTDIESRISENCNDATKTALAEYNSAKTNVDKVKGEQLELAKGFVSQFDAEIDKINEAYNTKNAQKIQKDNHVSTSKLFDGKSNLVAERINEDGIIPYVLIGPENVDPNEELPVLVFMHGSGGGTSSSNPYDFELASVIDKWNLEDFNGYILCPQLTGNYYLGNWNNEKAEGYIRDMLSSFEQNHAVDKNNIAVSGYSLGGMGSIYMSEHMDDIFTKSAVISGYDIGIDTKGIDIPIMGYVGKNENREDMKKLFERNLGEEYLLTLEAHHGNIDEEVFKRDSNQNGRSDIIEWLFNDKDYQKELPD